MYLGTHHVWSGVKLVRQPKKDGLKVYRVFKDGSKPFDVVGRGTNWSVPGIAKPFAGRNLAVATKLGDEAQVQKWTRLLAAKPAKAAAEKPAKKRVKKAEKTAKPAAKKAKAGAVTVTQELQDEVAALLGNAA